MPLDPHPPNKCGKTYRETLANTLEVSSAAEMKKLIRGINSANDTP